MYGGFIYINEVDKEKRELAPEQMFRNPDEMEFLKSPVDDEGGFLIHTVRLDSFRESLCTFFFEESYSNYFVMIDKDPAYASLLEKDMTLKDNYFPFSECRPGEKYNYYHEMDEVTVENSICIAPLRFYDKVCSPERILEETYPQDFFEGFRKPKCYATVMAELRSYAVMLARMMGVHLDERSVPRGDVSDKRDVISSVSARTSFLFFVYPLLHQIFVGRRASPSVLPSRNLFHVYERLLWIRNRYIDDLLEKRGELTMRTRLDEMMDLMPDDAAMARLIDSPEAGANDMCPCGSGRKFKKCCRRFFS